MNNRTLEVIREELRRQHNPAGPYVDLNQTDGFALIDGLVDLAAIAKAIDDDYRKRVPGKDEEDGA